MTRTNGTTRFALLSLGFLLLAAPFLTQTAAPQVVYTQFSPLVVRSDRSESVRFLARVTGPPTRVALELTGVENEMRDDGTGGDAAAGDAVYTLTLQASQIVQGLRADDVFRPFIGFLNVYQLQTRVSRGNIFAEVVTPEIARLPVKRLAPDAQTTAYVFNMVDSSFVTGETSDLTRITRKFYQYFSDDFDFLNVVYAITRFQNRFHFAVRNDVQGIGLSVFNNTAVYGSAGKLQGISGFPISSLLDGAEPGYQHELGHQWINALRVPPLESGIPHWPISSLASGIMGLSIPPTGQGGQYACHLFPEAGGVRLVPRVGATVFNDLEMYLMGLLAPEQVGEHIVFADQNAARSLPCNGLFTGATVKININAITNAVGPRVPDWRTAPKRFKVATLVVSKDVLLNEDEMAFYSFFAARAEETREVPYQSGFVKSIAKPFALSTGGRASLDAKVIGALPVTYVAPPNGGFSVTSRGASAPDPAVGYGRVVRDPGGGVPAGLAIFGLRQNGVLVTEATVPATAPMMSGRLYAEVGGAVNTGLAVANPNNQSVTLSFYFTSESGQRFGDGTTVIAAQGQIARFLDQQPFNGGGSIQGTFTFSVSAPVAVIALRGYTNERSEFLITTLPVADLSAPAGTGVALFPHFADGGGWATQFTLVNSTDDVMNGSLQFYSPGASPSLSSPGTPVQVTLDGQTANSFNYSVPPRSSRRLRTSGIGASIQVGSVRMIPAAGSRTPSAVGIFGFRENGVTVTEAGVPALQVGTAFRLYVESSGDFNGRAAGSVQSGLAIANASSNPATIALELLTLAGVSTGLAGTLVVPPNGQVARFFTQIPGFEALTYPFQGVLRVTTAAPDVYMLGLRARYNERREFLITTTTPNIDGAPVPNTDLFFPHFADGGGYATQFILLNGAAGALNGPAGAASGSMRFTTPAGQRLGLALW